MSCYIVVWWGDIVNVDKNSVSEREKLQKDLQNTKSALEDIKKEETDAGTNQENVNSVRLSGDEQVCVYTLYNSLSTSYIINLLDILFLVPVS